MSDKLPTPDEQWAECDRWREYLEAQRGSDRPVVNAFNDAWDMLNAQYAPSKTARGSGMRVAGQSPLEALFHLVALGLYPPPELLFTLGLAWTRYLDGAGNITLEKAFLGPPVPKAGNAARRRRSRARKLATFFEMARLEQEAITRLDAATQVVEELGLDVIPESIVRTTKAPAKTTKQQVGLMDQPEQDLNPEK